MGGDKGVFLALTGLREIDVGNASRPSGGRWCWHGRGAAGVCWWRGIFQTLVLCFSGFRKNERKVKKKKKIFGEVF